MKPLGACISLLPCISYCCTILLATLCSHWEKGWDIWKQINNTAGESLGCMLLSSTSRFLQPFGHLKQLEILDAGNQGFAFLSVTLDVWWKDHHSKTKQTSERKLSVTACLLETATHYYQTSKWLAHEKSPNDQTINQRIKTVPFCCVQLINWNHGNMLNRHEYLILRRTKKLNV